MRLLGIFTLLLLVGCRWSSVPEPMGSLPEVKAVYVYSDVARDRAAREHLLEALATRGVAEVFLQSAHLVRECPGDLEDLAKQARARGIRLSFLAGRAAWALRERHPEALAVAREAAEFAPRAGIESIQFDVEPYLLRQWRRNPGLVANQYLDLLESLRTVLAGRLRLHACIPFWFDRVEVRRAGRSRPLSEWVLDICDGAVMMDYRDSASRLVSGAEHELAYASQNGKSLVLAVNLAPSDERGTTFHGKSESIVRRELAVAAERLKHYPAFRGFAVFHHEAWIGVFAN